MTVPMNCGRYEFIEPTSWSMATVLKTVITDAGVVERDQDLLIQLGELGIRMFPVPPEAQFANPVERSIQTVVKGMDAMFVHREHLPNTVWSLELLEFIDATNACPNTVSGEYSPWYDLTGRHPVISERFRFRFGQPESSCIKISQSLLLHLMGSSGLRLELP
jgi:hypothetical protein